MQHEIDKRNTFADEVFSYRVSKDGRIFISWHTKQVKILKGTAAQKFLDSISQADQRQAQLIMAKVTGNFKRGNER